MATGDTVIVTIELFGTARMACGRRTIQAQLPSPASTGEIARSLAEACPDLVGVALRPDLAGLLESYVLNLNGTEFVEGQALDLEADDSLLLFSSQAGG